MAKILVVDDEEDIRKVIVSVFRSTGHNIIEAADGEEGIQLAITYTPELIISDVSMPKLDGMEMANVLSSHPGTSKIPIILLSAKRIEAKDQREGIAKGAREYFAKPFEVNDLLFAAEKLLREAELKRDMPWA